MFGKFKEFKSIAERESGCLLKVLRTDNALEYNSQEFKEFCSSQGIKRQLAAPYSSQQNGVAERKNITVLEMGRCLMNDKHLPKQFWVEVVNTTVYLLNQLPTQPLEKIMPFEAWHGKKPETKHIRIFGSICYSQVPDERRRKLDDKGEPGILLGCST